MERFTKRDKYGNPYTDSTMNDRFMWSKDGKIWERDLSQSAFDGKAIDKLCLLEDIEDELGCDLINLFKALKQGYIYVKLEDGIIKREVDMLDFKEGVRCVLFDKSCQVDNYMQCYQMLNYIQDYGKSWALTKEELKEE